MNISGAVAYYLTGPENSVAEYDYVKTSLLRQEKNTSSIAVAVKNHEWQVMVTDCHYNHVIAINGNLIVIK